MDVSKRNKKRFYNYFQRRRYIDISNERQIQASCARYHAWCGEQKRLKNKPITIIAEGDSWFKYVIGKGVIFQLERLLGVEIQNLASPGDEVSDMLAPRQLERLAKLLKQGPTKGWKYDCMLFSGGGNDFAGKDRFHKWFHQYSTGMTPKQLLNQKTIKAELAILEDGYEELIALRDKHSPKTHLFFHGYDFVIPNGKGVCWLGPWMQPGLEFRNVPKYKRNDVVKLFLQQFNRVLQKLERKHKLITVVPTHGTLNSKDWANELHPTNSGFKKIAKVFEEKILTR